MSRRLREIVRYNWKKGEETGLFLFYSKQRQEIKMWPTAFERRVCPEEEIYTCKADVLPLKKSIVNNYIVYVCEREET